MKMNVNSFVAVLSLVILNSAHAELKIWETDDEIRERNGDLHFSMSKMTNRDAEYGSFQAHALDRSNSISAAFGGPCSELITVQVTASDMRKVDASRFLQTRSGNDLPIKSVLDSVREAILSQCDNLEVVRFTFRPAHHTTEDYSYEGTMTKAGGWRILDGRVETAYDSAHTFELAYRDMFSVAGMRYKGRCEEKPVLILEPQFANNQERALAKPVKIHNWGMVARDVSKMYARECPKTQLIKFIINPLPQDYKCKTAGQDCFMVTRKSNEWEPDSSELDLKNLESPIGDFPDMVEVLAAGRFDIVKDYKSFFAFYLESFYGIYSDHCQSRIKDPVARDIYSIERRFGSDGSLLSEEVMGPPRRIYVERTHADTYDRYFNSWEMWAIGKLMSLMLNSHHRQTNPMLSAQLSVGFFTGNYKDLEDLVRVSCSDARLQTAYANMFNFANGKPAITGKYTTNKNPAVKDKKNGPSAPQMTQIIQEQQAAKVQADNAKKEAAFLKAKSKQQAGKPKVTSTRWNSSQQQPQQSQQQLLEDHQALQKKKQELGLKYQKEMMQATEKFAQDMQSATTNEQRQAIQQQYQKSTRERNMQMQKTMMELQGL